MIATKNKLHQSEYDLDKFRVHNSELLTLICIKSYPECLQLKTKWCTQ